MRAFNFSRANSENYARFIDNVLIHTIKSKNLNTDLKILIQNIKC